jgi:mono/diheme cytochrome c family protein
MSESDLSEKSKRGFYLATIGHCLECHTPFGPPGTGVDFQNSLGKGGREFTGPWGVSVSRNITSSKSKGIGDWSDTEIKRAVIQGLRRDGSQLKPPMGYGYYAKMTEPDVDAVVAYLRTLPGKE